MSRKSGNRQTVLTRIVPITDRDESTPMRQSGGGASVVVRDGNAVHMAKGGRIIRFEQDLINFNLEGSKWK